VANSPIFNVGILILWVGLIVALLWRLKRRRGHIGAGAAGAVYDMLNEDKRKAIELIAEEKTGERDPERATGPAGSGPASRLKP
jgi:hypothetical protein